MRIVHVCRQYSPAVGGIETVVERIAQHQIGQGHQVRVVTLNRLFGAPDVRVAERETLDGVDVVRLGFWGAQRYPIARGLLAAIRGCDLVHVHGIDFFFDFLAATRLLHRRPMIATTHGGFFHTAKAAALKRLWFASITRITSRAYSALIACSQADATLFSALGHRRQMLIVNGADTETFSRLADPDCKTILSFGRLAPNKGLERLLGWFAAIHQQDPEWRLIIAGRPSGVEPRELMREAQRRGIGASVSIVTTPDGAALRALMGRSSVFASASSYEGFGIAAIEAAAAGLMPVLSRIPPFERALAILKAGYASDFRADAREAERFIHHFAGWNRRQRDALAERAARHFGWDRALDAHDSLCSELQPPPVRRIGGIAIWAAAREEVLSYVTARLDEGRSFLLAFCNAHTVNVARRNPEVRRWLGSALVVNDGVGLDLASRWLFARAFPANLNGSDLTPAILARARRPLRIYILGSAPGVAERAARRLSAQFPHHQVVGVHHGFFPDDRSGEIVAEIRAARPDVVLIGMGQPRQEIWAARHLHGLPVSILCVGGYIDFAAGVVPRAPIAVQRLRLEWVYRLWREPRRLASRYLIGNATFLLATLKERWTGPGAHHASKYRT